MVIYIIYTGYIYISSLDSIWNNLNIAEHVNEGN